MHAAKSIAANFYYHGTLGYRLWQMRRACVAGRAPIAIVVFHRVANDCANAWTTPTTTFTKSIRWLRENCELISLEEVQRRIRCGQNHRASVSITFDDGYADNFNHAIPLLIREGIPCTYFVTAAPAIDGVPFEHDLATGKGLAPNTIEQLRSLERSCIEVGLTVALTRTWGKSAISPDFTMKSSVPVTISSRPSASGFDTLPFPSAGPRISLLKLSIWPVRQVTKPSVLPTEATTCPAEITSTFSVDASMGLCCESRIG